MTPNIYKAVQTIVKHIDPNDYILEIGALDINGSIRELFPKNDEYIGVDIVAGKGVDQVMDSHNLEYKDDYFDGVISICSFPHDTAWWKSLKEIKRVLIPGGWFILNVASLHCVEHNRPDYWRFTQDGVREILDEFIIKEWFDHENMGFDPPTRGITTFSRLT